MNTPTTRVPLAPLQTPEVIGAGMTHRGRVRGANEDAILTDPAGTLWAVSDGMGGYGHGDVASDIVIDALSEIQDGGAPDAELIEAIQRANARIMARADEGLGRMGATVVAALIQRAVAHVAWVGDSRAYLLRQGRLSLLTHDHSVVQDLVDKGALRPEDAEAHPESHIVTRAVGAGPDVEVDVIAVPLAPGDQVLICSDGLTRAVFETEIAGILNRCATPQDATHALLQAALEAGAPDNVSAIVLCVRGA